MQKECFCGDIYVIKRDETLADIAKHCGISLDSLLRMNPYLNPTYYLVGQAIIIPRK